MQMALDTIMHTGYVRFVLDIPELQPLLAQMDHPALQHFSELSGGAVLLNDVMFTEQEIKILHLVAKKRKNAEIAEDLYLSVSTVKWHLWNIYRKLDVKNRRHAVAQAQALGLIPQRDNKS